MKLEARATYLLGSPSMRIRSPNRQRTALDRIVRTVVPPTVSRNTPGSPRPEIDTSPSSPSPATASPAWLSRINPSVTANTSPAMRSAGSVSDTRRLPDDLLQVGHQVFRFPR